MNFPPIFAYVIFGFIWILQLVLDLTGVGAVVAEILAIIGEVFLFLWLFSRYGFGVFKKFSDAKNGKKFKKRFLIQLFGDLIPFVNMIPWNLIFIYQQHKEDQKEESGEIEPEENKNSGLLKTAATVGAVLLAPETGGASLAAEGALVGEAAAGVEAGATAESVGAKSIGSEVGQTKSINPWIKSSVKNNLEKDIKNKTITEEVSGVKTGQNFEDYNDSLKDYSDIRTYEEDLKEKEENQRKEEIEKQKEKDLRRMQGIKEDQNLREKMLEESNRRFGSEANEVKRLRDTVKDKYREDIEG